MTTAQQHNQQEASDVTQQNVTLSEPAPPAADRRWRPTPLAVGLTIVALAVIPFAVTTHRFLTWDNARAILASAAFVGITAIGATVVMIAGSAVSMATSQTATIVAMAFLATQQLGLPLAILLALACGVAITALQGLAIGYWDANPIVLTIAAGFAIAGFATWFSAGMPVYGKNDDYEVLNHTPLGIPISVYVMVGLALVVEWFLRRTIAGRQTYLVGENRRAARAAGLPVGRVTLIAWAILGLCVATTAIFLGSFHTLANYQTGGTLTLDAVAAVLVGGTAITGGRGSALRTLGGTILISVISDILLIRGYSTGAQMLVKGLLVLAVVIVVNVPSRRASR